MINSMENTLPRAKAETQAQVKAGMPGNTIFRWVGFVVLLILALIWIIPLAWTVDTALKPESETTTIPISWIPSHFTLDAFAQVLNAGNILLWYLNSAITSIIITVVTVLFSSMAAYALSRIRFPGRWLLFWLIMAGIMVPAQILIVPLFTEVNAFHMVNTYWGLILPQIAAPFAVFIFKQFFDGIPHELAGGGHHGWCQPISRVLANLAAFSEASYRGCCDIHLRGFLEQLPLALYCDHRHQYDDYPGRAGKCANRLWYSLCSDHGNCCARWIATTHCVHVLPKTDCSGFHRDCLEGLVPVRG